MAYGARGDRTRGEEVVEMRRRRGARPARASDGSIPAPAAHSQAAQMIDPMVLLSWSSQFRIEGEERRDKREVPIAKIITTWYSR